MGTWLKEKKFAANGYEQMLRSKEWTQIGHDQAYLNAGLFGHISQLNTWLASSLFLSVESQYASTKSNKSWHVLNWFETNFATFYANTENIDNLYTYSINDTQYQIWTTANLLLGMIVDKDTFDEMYNIPFYMRHSLLDPQLRHVNYPSLHVKYALYDKVHHTISFGLKTDGKIDVATSFAITNVDSLKQAILEFKGRVIDVTKYARLEPTNKTLLFTHVIVYFNGLNNFKIIF